jgi:hypothetical protein
VYSYPLFTGVVYSYPLFTGVVYSYPLFTGVVYSYPLFTGVVYSYLSPSTTAALIGSTVVILGSYSSLHLLGVVASSSSSTSSGPTSGIPEASLLSSCSFLLSHYSDIRASDAALGFFCLGILIAVKVGFSMGLQFYTFTFGFKKQSTDRFWPKHLFSYSLIERMHTKFGEKMPP